MAVYENDKVSPRWFTPSSEEGEENPLEFRIKPLTAPQYVEVATKADLNLAVRYALLGWKNYLDKNNNEVKFKLSKLDRLPPTILSELGSEIVYISTLSEDEKKTSE